MTDLFIRILNGSIAAGWLVLAVILLRLVLRRAPRWIFPVLWGIVGVRLLWPFSVESAVSLLPSAETVSPDIVVDPTPAIHSGISYLNSAVNPLIGESFAPQPGAGANPLQSWFFAASVLWLAGMAGMLLYAVISTLRLRRLVRGARRSEGNVFHSARVGTPFVLGIFRPRIYLPADLPERDAVHVLAHERAHIQRRDHWIKPIGFLLLSVHWFHPLLWIAYIFLCRDIELACDERVIRDLGAAERADYSEALLACSVSRRAVAACPVAFGEVGVKARVRSILHYKKPAFWILAAAVILSAVLAVCFLTDPKTPDAAPLTLHAFSVEEVLYRSPVFSDVMTAGEEGPFFAVTEYGDLLYRERDDINFRWIRLGRLTEFVLSKQNFDAYFLGGKEGLGWAKGESAAAIRRNTGDAWRLITDARGSAAMELVYLLRQEDGSVYLAVGANDPDAETNPAGDDSFLSRVMRLRENLHADTGNIAVSGAKSVPVKVFAGGTPLGEIADSGLHLLEIRPGPEDTVPFYIFCDGREQLGQFSIYDAETLQPLDYFRPSGLSPQTYLLQNAAVGRTYIIVMRTGMTAEYSGDLYCFRVHLPDPDAEMPKVAARYVFTEKSEILPPSVTLFEDGTFQFTFAVYSSYLGIGRYEITDGRLILRTDDGQFIYVFTVTAEGIAFDAGASSKQLWGGDFSDGSVFIPAY